MDESVGNEKERTREARKDELSEGEHRRVKQIAKKEN